MVLLLSKLSHNSILFNSIARCNRSFSSTTLFQPQKVLILTKLSRLEFEKLKHPLLTPNELEIALKRRGSDYNTLLYHHYIHKGCENRVEKCLQEFGVEIRIVNRFDYSKENIEWADLIVTTGGDGTFLMGANRLQNNEKPIIGFNTDPTRSEGYLCLPKKYSVNIREAVSKLFEGKFRWTFRKRIRVTLIGESVFQPPVELHDQQLQHHENRFYDCLQEENHVAENPDHPGKRVIPALALNEVYFGECVSARVSYFEVSVNGGEKVKTKNAGLCVSTGTGSTSWAYNISKISRQEVETICEILQTDGLADTSRINKTVINNITSNYNSKLIFNPESNKMLYTIRDPVSSYSLPYALEIAPRDLVSTMKIRSRCFDACAVIDGGLSFAFNDGAIAVLEMHDDDALRTVVDVM